MVLDNRYQKMYKFVEVISFLKWFNGFDSEYHLGMRKLSVC